MANAATVARVAELREKQERWKRERQVELERQAVTAELRREDDLYRPREVSAAPPAAPAAYTNGRPGSGGGAGPSGRDTAPPTLAANVAALAADSRVVNRLTERITDRLREELRVELAREGRAASAAAESIRARDDEAHEAQQTRFEGYLAKEIASHTCPICYELMSGIPPDRSPVLLFPCGHSFCSACLEQQRKVHGSGGPGKGKCPYCRKVVESRAPNMALQQLIQSYVAQLGRAPPGGATLCGNGGDPPGAATGSTASDSEGGLPPVTAADQAAAYARELRTVEMRVRILRNELVDSHTAAAEATGRRASAVAVLMHLQREEAGVRDQVTALIAELQLLAGQTAEQEAKVAAIDHHIQECEANAALIEATLNPLAAEAEKMNMLVLALGEG